MTVTKADFEKLFVNDPDLAKIERYLNRFNPLKIMKIEQMEIRHSAILGWLLNPQENHGLGDDFLKAFLGEATREHEDFDGELAVSALDVMGANLLDAEVLVEWNKIDLLVRCPSAGWVFIIENKVNSKLHSNQLQNYKKFAQRHFNRAEGTETIQGIFLTNTTEQPDDKDYCRVSYTAVYDSLSLCMEKREDALATNVREFINHYTETIAELTGMSTEQEQLKELAKKLFKENRAVLDFIYEHGNQSEFLIALKGLSESNEELEVGDDFGVRDGQTFRCLKIEKNRIWFLPLEWIEALGASRSDPSQWDSYLWKGCENWQSNYPVACYISSEQSRERNVDIKLVLKCEVGPLENHDHRVALIEQIKACPVQSKSKLKFGFQAKAAEKGKKYSSFLRAEAEVSDQHSVEEISNKIHSFLPEVGEALSRIEPALSAFTEQVGG